MIRQIATSHFDCDHTKSAKCVEPGGCEMVREARRLVALVDGKEG